MFTTRKTVTIVALALAGALSVGAVASAQAQAQTQTSHDTSGSASRSDRTPVTSVSPTPFSDDNGLRANGTVDDDPVGAVTPGTTPVPVPSTGLPTDADHPQGDDSIGRGDGDVADDVSDDGPGHDVGDDSHSGVSDDGAGPDVGDDQGGNSGPGSDDSSGHSGSGH